MSQNNQNGPKSVMPPKKRIDFGIVIIMALLIFGAVTLFNRVTATPIRHINLDQFENHFIREELSDMRSNPLGGQNSNNVIIRGTLTIDGQVYNFEFRTTQVTLDRLMNVGVNTGDVDEDGDAIFIRVTEITITQITENFFWNLLLSLLPFILIIGIFIYISRGAAGGNNKAFDFGKSRAKLSNSKNVTFKDVAGAEEEKEELIETVDFLKNPKKYEEMGARIPKGILLAGPPGTGKTLLAKACAGEANVPFFTISGSDFVEMFVGVGASRVRDLFKQAKASAPCIIFIDEIDAVGRQRGSGSGLGGGHSESEQTLNQLLVEMDGFSPSVGIVVMAATNRPDILDTALLRPGRFDRQITISPPDVKGREEILKVHSRNKKLDPSVKLDQLAQRIPGFSGADIENLLNEAALLAARYNRKIITIEDLDEATDRVMMGPAKKTRKISDKEKSIIAHHEAGHAVIGLKLDNANIVQKVTIIPRGKAGGYALMLPEEENYLETNKSLKDRITGYLGGRVAESIMFDEVSTGASHDFQMATKIARAMVTEYGMSDLGPIQYEQTQGRDYFKDKNFSDQIALEIDKETRKIVEGCYQIAKDVLTKHKGLMQNIAKYLIKVETLTRADIDEIDKTGTLKRAYPQEIIEKEKESVKKDKAKSDADAVVTEELESDN